MSWAFTLNGAVEDYQLDPALTGLFGTINEAYPADMELGLRLAKDMGLKTANISGFRTPSPYGGPDTIGVNVVGTIEAEDWFGYVKANIAAGPEPGAHGPVAGEEA
jgi:hypothetical protein